MSDSPPDLEVIGKAIYLFGFGESQIKDAISFLYKAISYSPNCPYWIENILKFKKKFRETENNLIKMREKLTLVREKEFKIKCVFEGVSLELNQCINRDINYIIAQQKLDFPEMKHTMVFPREYGFTSDEVQCGDVFQRALVVDTLLDLLSMCPDSGLDNIIEEEVEKIVAARLKGVKGGWSYFPQLRELPPDADTLGQVLQVFTKSKYKNIHEVVSEPIFLLLNNCSYEDGSFETWIVDNK